MNNCLNAFTEYVNLAEQLGHIDSVSLNLLFLPGNIGASVSEMADIMLGAVYRFSTKEHPRHLSKVQITIFQEHMVEQFAVAIKKKADEYSNSGYFTRAKGK